MTAASAASFTVPPRLAFTAFRSASGTSHDREAARRADLAVERGAGAAFTSSRSSTSTVARERSSISSALARVERHVRPARGPHGMLGQPSAAPQPRRAAMLAARPSAAALRLHAGAPPALASAGSVSSIR